MTKILHILIIVSFTALVQANAEPAKVLSLAQWRTQQVTEAENRIIRLSNRIKVVKASSGNISEINRLEAELTGAAQSVDMIKDLTIEDYFNVYLSQFADSDKTLVKAAKTMTKLEVAALLKALLKVRTNSASLDRSTSYITGLADQQNSEPKL